MSSGDNFESYFLKVLNDLQDYLGDLVLVGGWLANIYSRYLWNYQSINTITTTDIDFGISATKKTIHRCTIFDHLSSLDYTERHPEMNKMYPVVLYKGGKVRLDFISAPDIPEEIIKEIVGTQIELNKINLIF